MRDFVLLYINGRRHEVRGADGFATVTDFLRRRAGLTGTKVVCEEGDCGACTVIEGRPVNGRLDYRAVDACIQFIYQLDRTHLVTVEGLTGKSGALSPVQQAMVDCHGSQCGFCTPGFVMMLIALFETGNGRRTEPLNCDEMRTCLTGNLCRCTGYVQIMDAGKTIDPAAMAPLDSLFPPGEILDAFSKAGRGVLLTSDDRETFIPATLDEAVAYRERNPECTIVSGATDIGVQVNRGRIAPRQVLHIGAIGELATVSVENGQLVAGACATWASIEEVVRDHVPQYAAILERFGSPQIRNAGTIGGNFANASPIADSLPFHFVSGTIIEAAGPRGQRLIPIEEFYLGYKKLALRPGELIARIFTPLPGADDELRLYKISRRRDLDISSFTAAVMLRVQAGTIVRARIAMGGVGPVVLRLHKAEAALEGQPFTADSMAQAGQIAAESIAPITDVRGAADYRRTLARNIFRRFHRESEAAKAGVA